MKNWYEKSLSSIFKVSNKNCDALDVLEDKNEPDR